MSPTGGLGCGGLSDPDGMITGCCPSARQVVHERTSCERKKKGPRRSPQGRLLSNLAMQHRAPRIFSNTDMSREKVCATSSHPPNLPASLPPCRAWATTRFKKRCR